ncbi:hypothetical protein FVEG_01290 [Fusarium verticillioides 7600]|uniref:Uncharacterized protein n=1 Tax=Gibberella moniliformis (strain M3125 / FGSC 7600) TaxID=334819 RepID=W7LQP6_GIBM7|nr:hypothetical protein FVEG_01290 [Fusarium verticillioides 7600]EWG37834.1 hypothetical protein FVEG_01290 [Fusarium verticillioides 7600]
MRSHFHTSDYHSKYLVVQSSRGFTHHAQHQARERRSHKCLVTLLQLSSWRCHQTLTLEQPQPKYSPKI